MRSLIPRVFVVILALAVVVATGCENNDDTGGELTVTGTDVAGPNNTNPVVDLDIDAASTAVVNLVWTESDGSIWFATSTDAGANWSTPFQLAASGASEPRVCSNGATVHAVWAETSRVKYRRSTNSGTAWAAAVNLDPDATASVGLSLACSGIYMAVSWLDSTNGQTQPYANHSANDGATLAGAQRVPQSAGVQALTLVEPSLAVSGTTMSVVYRDPSAQAIYLSQGTVGGASPWPNPEPRVDDNNNVGTTGAPRVSIGSATNMTWPRDIGSDSIEFNATSNGGTTMLLALDISLDTNAGAAGDAASRNQEMVSSGNNIVVCWEDDRDTQKTIYANRSTDGGTNWLGADVRISEPTTAIDEVPVIGYTPLGILVAWEDTAGGGSDVFLDYSTDLGASWQANDIKLNSGSNNASSPRIATSGSTGFVAWLDSRNGPLEIFLRRVVFAN